MIIPTLPISFIRNYTYLSFVSLPGIVVGIIGTIMILIYCGHSLSDGNYNHEPNKDFNVI